MSGTIGKSLSLSSPLKAEEEAKQFIEKKQGIVSILGSDCGQITKAASLRRTLSADMSSKKWLAQHEFSPMKKIASSEELSPVADSFSSSEGEEEDHEGRENELERPGQDDVWRSIQSQKKKLEKPRKFDTWGSILSSDKAKEDLSKLSPPYVHPLVRRSTGSLSEKSLQICTESLGSETGSDGYSYASSETGDVAEDHDNREEVQQFQQEKESQQESESQSFFDRDEFQLVKYNYSTSKKLSPKSSFPPPLPSLTPCDGEISLQVQSHRKNGRLVLEAVSLPSQNCFRAQRQDGRLLLTFADNPLEEPLHAKMTDQEEEELADEIEEGVFKNFVEEEEEGNDYDSEAYEETEEEEEDEVVVVVEKIEKEEGAKEIGIVMEQAPMLSSGVINVHRSAIMMKKLLGLDNRNPTWTHKFNKAVNLEVDEEEEEEDATTKQLPQSLPRMGRLIPAPPAPAAATSFNAYEYFWRTKPTVATLINPITQQNNTSTTSKLILSNNSPKGYEQRELVLLRGNKAHYLVPLLRGCKEARRSLFFWEPYCIATS